MILQKIIDNKKKELLLIKKLDFGRLKASERNFKACLKGKNNIIAEIKRKSPSEAGLFDGDVKDIAEIYDRYANAISIVVDEKFFGGSKEDIKKIKEVTKLPVLCKDFIIDKNQILELRHYGADAVLLIASLLSKERIDEFISVAKKYSMDCLVEVHTEEELRKVLETKAEIIGINNRDLSTFKVELETTKRLRKLISHNKIVVSESGFNDIKEIKSVGVNAVLIGTSLLKSNDISKKLSSLRKPKVKICGITNIKDAHKAVRYGADFLGFNFYEKSPRYIKPEIAKDIIDKLPNTAAYVGVFVNESAEKVKKISDIGLDVLQFHGNEDADYCSSFSLPVIKAFKVDMSEIATRALFASAQSKRAISEHAQEHASPFRAAVLDKKMPDVNGYDVFAYLFDTFDKELYGGTGKSFDFNVIKNVNKKIFLSGGLNSESIKEALKSIDPYCVDVCSGVEKEKGIKDKEKIRKFIQAVKA